MCCVLAGQYKLLPVNGQVKEEGLLGADQVLPPVWVHRFGMGVSHIIHHGE